MILEDNERRLIEELAAINETAAAHIEALKMSDTTPADIEAISKRTMNMLDIEPFMETNVIENPEVFQRWITAGAERTFLIKIDSNFGEDYDILCGDWIIVDRKREPQKNDMIVNFAPGGFVVINYHLGLQFVEKLSPGSRLQQQQFFGVVVTVIRKTVKN